jgi:hypothetical protein
MTPIKGEARIGADCPCALESAIPAQMACRGILASGLGKEHNMSESRSMGSKLLAAVAVLVVVAGALSILMPSLRSAKQLALRKLSDYEGVGAGVEPPLAAPSAEILRAGEELATAQVTPLADVNGFDAAIDLTPMLSVGTATPESIYEARFEAALRAKAPASADPKCELRLPLPHHLVSLANLEIKVNGEAKEDLSVEDGHLVWRGKLDTGKESEISVAYTAVGKGLYTVRKPPGGIIDTFKARLVAHNSDIRMLELSLQPKTHKRDGQKTIYTWDYSRLLMGRPIAVDVLGIAAVDRLGELVWLGPVSVLVFGVLVCLVALAHRPEKVNIWMLVLIVGCFAGAYPLMYFLQESLDVAAAVGVAAAAVLIIVAVRAITILGPARGIFGGIAVPAVVMALTLGATIYTRPAVQGVLLTAEGIFALVVAMVFLPKVQGHFARGRAAAAHAGATGEKQRPAGQDASG